MNLIKIYENLNAKQAAFIAVFFWASNYPITKYILNNTDVNTLAVLRYLFAGIILVIFSIRKKIGFPNFSELPLFFLAGLLGFSAYFIIFNIAMTKISSSTASVVNSLVPAMTAILAYFFFKEKIKPMGWFSLFISFIGIVILTLWNGILSINSGIFYIFTSAFFLSLYNISQKWLSKKYPSLKVIIYSMIMGSLQLVIYSPSSLLKLPNLNIPVILAIIYTAIFPAIISYFLWTRALEIAKSTTEVTSFMFCAPVLTAIMSALILGEIPELSTFIGGSIVIFGMFLFSKTKN